MKAKMSKLMDCAFQDGSYPCGYKDEAKLPDCDLCHKVREASIREVVEWLHNNSPTIQIGQDIATTASGFGGKIGDTTYYPLIKLLDWQAKLKEWGIK